MHLKDSLLKISFLTISIVLVWGLFQIASAQSIYLEWVDNPLESMVVNWVDEPGKDPSVDFRLEGAEDWFTGTGNSRSIPNSAQKVYTVKLGELRSGEGYEFRVGGSSEIYKFRTAPEKLDGSMRFIVAGDLLDSGGSLAQAKQDFEKVSTIAASYNPYFVVIGGDLANAEGKLENVDQWFFLFKIWHQNMRTDDGYLIPIQAAVGNNELTQSFGGDPDDAPFYYTFFRYPQDQWGSKISYGKLDFNEYLSIITLDSDHTQRIPGTQTNWLKNTLRNRDDVRHVIPVYHVAGWPTFFSRTFRFGQEALVRDNWHPVFRDHKIRLAFEHHDHIYKRTLPFGECSTPIEFPKDCKFGEEAKDGVIYMGGGSWGSNNNRDSEFRWYHDKVTERIHNFVVVEITDNSRKASAIGENGQVLDTFIDFVYLKAPTVLFPSNVTKSSFTARWEPVEGTTNYRIDVSTDPDFNSYVQDIRNKSLGDRTSFTVENLDPSKTYYYRLNAANDLTSSKNSETMAVKLVIVDPELSSLEISEEVVIADQTDSSIITATVIDEDGEKAENVTVRLSAEEGTLITERNDIQTDSEGQAQFKVFNNVAEVVTYKAEAVNTEFSQKVKITFIPVAPIGLSASDIENRRFTANWEAVNNADSYQIDVARDNDFTNLASGYDQLDVGNVTSYDVSGIDPGETYFVRVRAVTNDLIGADSQVIELSTFPDTPVAANTSKNSVVSFTVNWEAAEGAQSYRLDVSRDSNFENFVEDYNDKNVGNVQSAEVTGLLPGNEYFYRVRAESNGQLSGYSNSIRFATLNIDRNSSAIETSQLRVIADGQQAVEIYTEILDENGELQEGVPVQVTSQNTSTTIEGIESKTNQQGVATHKATNTEAEKVTYNVVAANVQIGTIEIEFIQGENDLVLGNSFPNPFRNNASIPFQIPSAMRVELTVYNSLGAPVRVLYDKVLETGYYEIPFNGSDLAAGVYFYRLVTEDGTKTGKMVLVK